MRSRMKASRPLFAIQSRRCCTRNRAWPGWFGRWHVSEDVADCVELAEHPVLVQKTKSQRITNRSSESTAPLLHAIGPPPVSNRKSECLTPTRRPRVHERGLSFGTNLDMPRYVVRRPAMVNGNLGRGPIHVSDVATWTGSDTETLATPALRAFPANAGGVPSSRIRHCRNMRSNIKERKTQHASNNDRHTNTDVSESYSRA